MKYIFSQPLLNCWTRICVAPFLNAQTIVNTYGIPRYKEANPALFAIVTFPFLFGMMYGDIGHGSLLFLFGCYLVYNAASRKGAAAESEMMGTIYNGRYLLAMMGACAVYVGFCYNDCMSLRYTAPRAHCNFINSSCIQQ